MHKKYIIPMIVFFFLLSGCSQTPEQAKEELQRKGYTYTPTGIYTAVYQGNVEAVDLFFTAGVSGKMFEYAIMALARDRYFNGRPNLNTDGSHAKDDVILTKLLATPIAEQYKKQVPKSIDTINGTYSNKRIILQYYANKLIHSLYERGKYGLLKAEKGILEKTYKALVDGWANMNVYCVSPPISTEEELTVYKRILLERELSLSKQNAASFFASSYKPVGGEIISYFLDIIGEDNADIQHAFEVFVNNSEKKLVDIAENILNTKQSISRSEEQLKYDVDSLYRLQKRGPSGQYTNYIRLGNREIERRIKKLKYNIEQGKLSISQEKHSLEEQKKQILQEATLLDKTIKPLINKCKCLSDDFVKNDLYLNIEKFMKQ